MGVEQRHESTIALLRELQERGAGFNWQTAVDPHGSAPGQYGGPETPAWIHFKTRVKRIILRTFSDGSTPIELLNQGYGVKLENGKDHFRQAQRKLVAALQVAVEILQDPSALSFDELRQEQHPYRRVDSQKVFVVHGHDEQLKTETEVFLTSIGLKPIVLHRQPNKGRTIIEKLEKHSDVGFAFILLTPDEIAYLAAQASLPESERATEFRARPNVIFEFGYFVGLLGRKHVCCLYKGRVALPSDVHGVIYMSVDDGVEAKGVDMMRELQAAGYKVSLDSED
ncbi:MAG: nucleotide-binding protein [Planctomycetales bacterium]|nr:nucleotide-binding protein [Planctomycetales bacterium]